MNMFRKYFIFILMAALFLLPQSAFASYTTWFQISNSAGEAFKKTPVYIFSGDVKFKAMGGADIYPYGEKAKTKPYYMGEVITDEKGEFGLDMNRFEAGSLVFITGYVFAPLKIEKSDNLSHNFSNNHLRVVLFEKDSSKVIANEIYDLKAQLVKTIPVQGKQESDAFDRIIPLRVRYMDKLAPYTSPLEIEKEGGMFEELRSLDQGVNLDIVYQALVGDHFTLRAYAATYLGKYGTEESIAYLIDALSDESGHVGVTYVEAGMATTRHRAKRALTELTGKDFGFKWNASLEERAAAIRKWKDWFNKRKIIIDEVLEYAKTQGIDLSVYKVQRMLCMSPNNTKWAVSFARTPAGLGAPIITIDTQTHEKKLIKGR